MEKNIQKELMEQYIENGKKYIIPEKIDNWISYVNSTKGNMESLHTIAYALELIGLLDYGFDIKDVIKNFNSITCPVSLITIRSLVANFSLRGPEFFEKTATEPISEENQEYLERLKQQNTKLTFIKAMKDAGYNVQEVENGPIVVSANYYDELNKNSLKLKKDE